MDKFGGHWKVAAENSFLSKTKKPQPKKSKWHRKWLFCLAEGHFFQCVGWFLKKLVVEFRLKGNYHKNYILGSNCTW